MWCFAFNVHSERLGVGEHFSNDVDPLLRGMSSEGQCNAEGSATQGWIDGASCAWTGRWPKSTAHACDSQPWTKSQSHPILAAVVLRLVPRTSMRGHDPDGESRMWPDRPLAMIKLDMKKAVYQLRQLAWPEVALGVMRQMTGAKVMPVVGGRCCQKVPMERGIRQGRPESMDLFVLVLCYFLGPLVQKWCDQNVCGYWWLTRMLSDFSAEPKGLRHSFCTPTGKCAWLGNRYW